MRLRSKSGVQAEFNANGSLHCMRSDDVAINLFVGDEIEGGPANLWLRTRRGARRECTPLLGPRSITRFELRSDVALVGSGQLSGLRYSIAFALSLEMTAWFWRVSVENVSEAQEIDLIYTQDLALAPYAAVRLNEYYVSQYLDHTPLEHRGRGVVIASRQNLAVVGRHPWCAIGSLHRAVSYATDAMQVYGLASRTGGAPHGLIGGLPDRRLQHEHAMTAIQDAPVRLERGGRVNLGFFGVLRLDHPAATSAADLVAVEHALSAPEAQLIDVSAVGDAPAASPTVFSAAPLLDACDFEEAEIATRYGADRRCEERDEQGGLLSFFDGSARHVVLRAKEVRVLRPHGHMLRTGRSLAPDESALTSTTWMNGVFHSMLTQGHVSANRLLSTTRSYIGLFRSHGQRVFAEVDGAWRLLDTPSAFEMTPDACCWLYRYAAGLIEVRSGAHSDPHAFTLDIEVREGAPLRFLISHHIALNGDDGAAAGAAMLRIAGEEIAVFPAEGSELRRRFPEGSFVITALDRASVECVGGDELLFLDGRSRDRPYLCIRTAPVTTVGLRIQGRLVSSDESAGARAGDLSELGALRIEPPPESALAAHAVRLAEIAPWFTHNALVHYLSPRGLEQYSGGGWGTRDVCQGPVELLLASGCTAPVRDLLLRVMRAQHPHGDWPQWFMFFERDRNIRAGDSHGDIVFWPLLALAQYLLASGDATLLDERAPYFEGQSGGAASDTVWGHVEQALCVIDRRVIKDTALAAYGCGDWNDSLQPADPAMREHMCSAWTVTLHHQTLTTLARALRLLGRDAAAAGFDARANEVRADFRRFLLVDDVLTGYASFDADGVHYLLHPRDTTSGVRYSSLAMIHAILEGMLTPEEVREHLRLLDESLSGPDGVRLFDQPMAYHGGPEWLFRRAESATFFGREIGLMYMHAHLRYAQALAHVGDAERFFRALCQVNPIGLRELVPQATLRQANCYYSSSDAAFADRYEASAGYDRVKRGAVALEGGWRVYSSGAGIAMGLILRNFLGLAQTFDALSIDPVMPAALSGLRATVTLFGRSVEVIYEVAAAGCGVSAVEFNGVRLAHVRESNPYRAGALRVSKTDFAPLLREEMNVMKISIGQGESS